MEVSETLVKSVSSVSCSDTIKIKNEVDTFVGEITDPKDNKLKRTNDIMKSCYFEYVIKQEDTSIIDHDKVKVYKPEIKPTCYENEFLSNPLDNSYLNEDQEKKELIYFKGDAKYETFANYSQELASYNVSQIDHHNEDTSINLCSVKKEKEEVDNCIYKEEPEIKEKSENRITYTTDINNCRSSGDIQIFRCKECCYVTTREACFTKHMKLKKHNQYLKLLKCNKCCYLANWKHILNGHVKTRHEDELTEKFECFRCSFKTVYKHALETHVQMTHFKNELYKCNECGSVIKRKSDLIVHMKRKHSISEKFKCSVCDFQSSSRYDLTRHCKRKHNNGHEIFKCKECMYETAWEPDLKRHLKSAHGETIDGRSQEIFKCSMCNHQTKWNHHLVLHVKRKHSSDYKFKCSFCSYQAKVKHDLTLHVKKEHGQNPIRFVCYHCGHQFKEKRSLQKHITRKHFYRDFP